jgi:hypothetical protein
VEFGSLAWSSRVSVGTELWAATEVRCTLDRSDRWYTYLGSGVVATLSLALLLPFMVHDSMVVL